MMKINSHVLHFCLPLALAAAVAEFPIKDTDGTGVDSPPRSLKGKNPLFQVDPRISRVELVGAHTKWLFCSSAFWVLTEGQCEESQRFVPDGYWFETGRPVPEGTECNALTGDGDVPTVVCRVKKGLTMVLPVVNYFDIACIDGVRVDPKVSVKDVLDHLTDMRILKATLDGADVPAVDAIPVVTQDGDADYTLAGPRGCSDFLGIPASNVGCPIVASGQYVFIDTKKLAKGPHELLLIGESPGVCSAVKHQFTLY